MTVNKASSLVEGAISPFRALPDEVLVVRFRPEELDLVRAKEQYDSIKHIFPNNEVLMIPYAMSLEALPKSQLQELRGSLLSAIDTLIGKILW